MVLIVIVIVWFVWLSGFVDFILITVIQISNIRSRLTFFTSIFANPRHIHNLFVLSSDVGPIENKLGFVVSNLVVVNEISLFQNFKLVHIDIHATRNTYNN